jgi:hypothetical protein
MAFIPTRMLSLGTGWTVGMGRRGLVPALVGAVTNGGADGRAETGGVADRGAAVWGGRTVRVERFGGIRDLDHDRHEGGQWSVLLPSER